MVIHPQHTYVHLADDGKAQDIPGESFWQLSDGERDGVCTGWLVSEFMFTEDWPTWEMHPQGDEFVYLLSGAIDFLLERDLGVETIALEGSGAVVVPRGVWHTAKVRLPSRVLHLTRGQGTQNRPV